MPARQFLDETEVQLDAAVMKIRLRGCVRIGRSEPRGHCLAVMEKTEHVLLIGEGAERFALAAGFDRWIHSLVQSREYEDRGVVRAGRPMPGYFRRRREARHGRVVMESAARPSACESLPARVSGTGKKPVEWRRALVAAASTPTMRVPRLLQRMGRRSSALPREVGVRLGAAHPRSC